MNRYQYAETNTVWPVVALNTVDRWISWRNAAWLRHKGLPVNRQPVLLAPRHHRAVRRSVRGWNVGRRRLLEILLGLFPALDRHNPGSFVRQRPRSRVARTQSAPRDTGTKC